MDKFKKIIAILLMLTFVPIGSFANYLTDEQKKPSYDPGRNVQMWSVENKDASSGTRYRTLAFKAKIKSKDKINGKEFWYTANIPKMDDPEKRVEHKPDKISLYHYMNYVSNTGNVPPGADSLYNSFYRQYKDDKKAMDEINELFSKGGIMYLDSVGTVTDDGKQRGEVDVSGYAKKGDEKNIYDTLPEFLCSAGWLPGTQKTATNMFDIKIDFPPQPVITPVPHITKGTGTTDVTSVEYKEGEVFDLVGIHSFFPKAVNREYEWSYKKKGVTTWTPCGKKATPNLTSLPIGEYDIKLDVQYTMSAFWGDNGKIIRKSVAPATCVIKVIPNSEIVATATVSSPADVEIESDATFANIPVTINSNLINIGGGKVKSVTYQLMTEEGSPIYTETFGGSETLSQTKTFKITYKGEPFTQGFKGQVTYVLESGTNKYSKWAISTTYIHKKGVGNLPPVPVISPIADTISGNEIRLNGASSYDPDGEVVSWEFSIPQWGYYYNEDGKKSTWKTTIGYGNRVQAILGVTDDDGAYSETSTFFNVTPPPPILNINVSGALKENRKVIFISNVTNLAGYTTTDSQVEWTVSSLGGQTTDKIKLKATVGKSIQGLFKEKGQYLVECKATNSANMSANQSILINISEDFLPTVVVDTYETVYRNDEKKAEIKVFDNSYSVDNDYIASRSWYYALDKDNDGRFDDETLTLLKTATLPEDNSVSLITDKVGKYQIYLRVQEGFGQETIPEFIAATDYKINSGYKIVEVDNYKPVVSFVPMKDKKVDMVVVTDYKGDKLTQLGTRLNQYIGESFENGINVKLQVATDSKYIGRYLPENGFGWNKVPDNTTAKYVVARWNTYSGDLIEYSDNSYEITTVAYNVWLGTSSGDIPKTTIGVFPARVKQVQTINRCTLILLENGDLYFVGTNMAFQRPYYSPSLYQLEPKKTMSGVKTIIQNQLKGGWDDNQALAPMLMHVLTYSGDVYSIGEVPTAYRYQGAIFTTIDEGSHLNMQNLFATTTRDDTGYARYGNYGTRTMVGTEWGLSKLNGLSNITYARDTGSGLIARDSNGDWWGFGSNLNAFGHHTGFTSTHLSGYGVEAEVNANSGMYDTTHHFDEFNNIVKLQNLSDIDKAVGGIYKVDIGKAYANNGDVYTFKQTPELYFGEGTGTIPAGKTQIEGLPPGIQYKVTWTSVDYAGNTFLKVFYPFQLGKGTFSYSKIGTIEDETKALKINPPTYMYSKIGTAYVDKEVNLEVGYNPAIPQVDAEYIYSAYYENLLMERNINISGATQFTNSQGGSQWTTPPPTKLVKYFEAPVKTATGEINTFEKFYYKVEYTLSSWTTSSHWAGRGDDDDSGRRSLYYDRIGTYNYKVTGYKPEVPSTQVVGWKFYGVDLAKLPSTTFRPNSEKYIIYIGEKDSFQKVEPSLLAYIKANNIKVKVVTDPKYLDRATTKSVEINLRDMITATPNGKLYPSDGLETMLADMTEENKVFTEAQDGLYVIKDEDTVTYTSYYNDIESDTKLSEVYNHLHTSAYFENGEGQSAYHNIQRTIPISVFDKVGLYNVYYRAKDQPSTDGNFQNYNKDSDTAEMKVYVHRRPIAKIDIQYTNIAPFTITGKDDTSYDLDHQSQANRGIIEVEWQYRKSSDTVWERKNGPLGTEIKVSNLKKGDTVYVSYRVKDQEGAWSQPVYKEITPEVRLLMDADLKSEDPKNKLTAFPTGNNVVFSKLWTSYPYAHHLEIQMYDGNIPLLKKAVLTKETGQVTAETPFPERTWKDHTFFIPQMVNGNLLTDKTYTFKVTAYDSSDPKIFKEKLFNVTTISNRPPTVDFVKWTPTSLYEGDQHEMTLTVNDPDKDLLKLDVYLKCDQKPEVLYQSFQNLSAGQQVNLKPFTIHEGKSIQWRAVVTDPKGESGENRKLLPIQAFGIDSITVKGAWNHWRGQKNAFGQQMTNEPNRFLSMEKLTFAVTTRGEVSKVSIKLSPELEAMAYKDPKGKTYYYKDELGYNVEFPIFLKPQNSNIYSATYILPFADSTISWENNRKKKPYLIYVTLENKDRKRLFIYGDDPGEVKIDITGNIFDLLYNQPTK